MKTALATITFDDTSIGGLGVDATVELAMDMEHGNMWTRECEIKSVFIPVENEQGEFVLENIVDRLNKDQLEKIQSAVCKKAHDRANAGRAQWSAEEI